MDEDLLIPMTAILMPMILVPTIITMVHRQRKREWHHKERLRALELGLPPAPTSELVHPG
jgi:preprotein translocase subunit YajC